jgi:hypothetical protein
MLTRDCGVASSPEILVSAGLRVAQMPGQHDRALGFLRAVGNPTDVLRAGCNGSNSIADTWSVPMHLIAPISERSARAIYQEMTGEDFERAARRLDTAQSSIP